MKHGIKMFRLNKQRGFTLIELLVVISIIGALSTIAMTSMNSARSKARDARRLSNLDAIKNALAIYYSDHGTYPEENPQNGTVEWSYEDNGAFIEIFKTEGYFSGGTPLDPVNNSNYSYGYYKFTNDASCGSMVVLVGNMETNTYYERSSDCSCRSWMISRDWVYCEKY